MARPSRCGRSERSLTYRKISALIALDRAHDARQIFDGLRPIDQPELRILRVLARARLADPSLNWAEVARELRQRVHGETLSTAFDRRIVAELVVAALDGGDDGRDLLRAACAPAGAASGSLLAVTQRPTAAARV